MKGFSKQRFMQSTALFLTLYAGVQMPHVVASSSSSSQRFLEETFGIKASKEGSASQAVFNFCYDPDSTRVTTPLPIHLLPTLPSMFVSPFLPPEGLARFNQSYPNAHNPTAPVTQESIKQAARELFNRGVSASQSGFVEYLQSMAYWEALDHNAPSWTPQDSYDFAMCALFFGKELESVAHSTAKKRAFVDCKEKADLFRVSSKRSLALANIFAMKYLSNPVPGLTYLERYMTALMVSFSQGACVQDGETCARLDAAMGFLAPVFEGGSIMTCSPLVMSHLHLQRYALGQGAGDVEAARNYLERFHEIVPGPIPSLYMFKDYERLLGELAQKGIPDQESFAVLAAAFYHKGLRESMRYEVSDVGPLLRYFNIWIRPFKDKFRPAAYADHLTLVAHMSRTFVQNFDLRYPAPLEDMADFYGALSLGIEAYDTVASLSKNAKYAAPFLQYAADLHAKRLNALGDFTGEYATTRLPQGGQMGFLMDSAKAHLRAAEASLSPTLAATGREKASQDLQKAMTLGLVAKDTEEKALMGEILRSLPLRLSKEIENELDWHVKTDLAQRALSQWEAYLNFTGSLARNALDEEPREVLHALFLGYAACCLDKIAPKKTQLDTAIVATFLWRQISPLQTWAVDDYLLAASSLNVVGELSVGEHAQELKRLASQLIDEIPHGTVATNAHRAKALAKIYGDAASAAKEPDAARAHMKKSLEHMHQAMAKADIRIFEIDLVPLMRSLAHIWQQSMPKEERLALVNAASPLMPFFLEVMSLRTAPLQQKVLDEMAALQGEAAAFARRTLVLPMVLRTPALGAQEQGGSHASSSSQ